MFNTNATGATVHSSIRGPRRLWPLQFHVQENSGNRPQPQSMAVLKTREPVCKCFAKKKKKRRWVTPELCDRRRRCTLDGFHGSGSEGIIMNVEEFKFLAAAQTQPAPPAPHHHHHHNQLSVLHDRLNISCPNLTFPPPGGRKTPVNIYALRSADPPAGIQRKLEDCVNITSPRCLPSHRFIRWPCRETATLKFSAEW